ncbi:MAG TPA: type IV secretion system protein [Sphingobium sp.]
MNDSEKPDSREEYYREAGSWAGDQASAVQKVQRRTWLVIGTISLVAVGEALALVALTPLKTVVPYTLLVDRNTGYIQALDPLDAQTVSANAALTQSFAVQYVIARESFNIATVQSEYRKTALWSAERARSDYIAQMQISNPASPLNHLPRSTIIETFVKSVLPLGPRKVQIRFATSRRDAGGQPRQTGNWVAIVTYLYSSAPLNAEDRFLNPLGFQVISYSKAQEALPVLEAASVGPEGAPFAPSNGQPVGEPGR